MNLNKPVFLASSSNEASSQKKILEEMYGKNGLDNADVIVVLGGDGFMLSSLKKYNKYKKAFYGINAGSYGFLMNKFSTKNTIKNLSKAKQVTLSRSSKVASLSPWRDCA